MARALERRSVHHCLASERAVGHALEAITIVVACAPWLLSIAGVGPRPGGGCVVEVEALDGILAPFL